MNTKRVYVDIHVLQTVPPSCVNRDDTGSPKTARYGGVSRARVSSQCWKHAVRTYFRDHLDESRLATRTKNAEEKVADFLVEKGYEEAAALLLAENALKDLQVKASKDGKKDALFFISHAQAKAVAEIIDAVEKDPSAKGGLKEALKKAVSEAPGLEIALFGRMVAGDTSLNVDACCQVAHALSTHKVSNEFDYYTAVDDLHAEDEERTDAGAGHIGSTEFNSSTLYRYATIAVHDLYEKTGEEAPEAVKDFVEAFICSMPTGKQNSFANRTVPDAVLVTIREDQPVNFVGAFENPVKSSEGYVNASKQRLEEYAHRCYQSFVSEPVKAFSIGGMDETLGEQVSLKELLVRLEDTIREELMNERD